MVEGPDGTTRDKTSIVRIRRFAPPKNEFGVGRDRQRDPRRTIPRNPNNESHSISVDAVVADTRRNFLSSPAVPLCLVAVSDWELLLCTLLRCDTEHKKNGAKEKKMTQEKLGDKAGLIKNF